MVEILNLYHMCKTFNQLPCPGGVLDQPARLMYVFEAISSAELEKANMEQEKENKRRQRAGNRA